MANIFNKKFEDITYSDIESLVENKVPESTVLDYKLLFDKKETAKLICALSNTYGGFIIYGVKTNQTTNLPESIENIEDKKLDDSIDSICFDSITEPVTKYTCGYRISEDGKKQVFLVRVFESDLTPHAVENNTTVYIKVMAQKRPIIEKEKVNNLAWLYDRRKKSVDLRDKLINQACERARENGAVVSSKEICTDISVYPLYPKEALIPYNQIHYYSASKLSDFAGEMNLIVAPRQARNLDQGFCEYREQNGLRYYVEFNTLGIYHVSVIVPWDGEPESNRNYVQLQNFGCNLFVFFRLGIQLLIGLDYKGSIGAKIRISGIKGSRLLCPEMDSDNPYPTCKLTNDKVSDILCEEIFSHGTKDEFIQNAMTNVCGRFVHVYGLPSGSEEFATSVVRRTLGKYKLEFDKQIRQFKDIVSGKILE